MQVLFSEMYAKMKELGPMGGMHQACPPRSTNAYSPCTLMDYASNVKAKCNTKAKYTITQKVNYREEDEIINKPLSCTELVCNEYQTNKDGVIDLSRSK